ncbi:hypothetical protein [Leucobacter ruminantium]|uniref:Uncharacterized protein n=1 Tax=Leucobacter ruminantium TaxID=1289170 RepID=A0A939RUL7_9MICO|nr:hypothetical protein [Leucobacter ruminantium]MBO1805910.1 hypothetical protein [Leucobacter ruminantium]
MTKRTQARAVDIIIAVDQTDARAYADKHGHWPHVAVTPRSMLGARGRVAPVYATRKARLHPRYADMLAEAKPAGATIPRRARDRRVG